MSRLRIEDHWRIWLLALGYFAFYIPYSALTKALSLGLLPGMTGPVSGFRILPATAVATSVALVAFMAMGGGWGRLRRRRVLGLPHDASFFSSPSDPTGGDTPRPGSPD